MSVMRLHECCVTSNICYIIEAHIFGHRALSTWVEVVGRQYIANEECTLINKQMRALFTKYTDISQDMERRTSTRLTAMERNQTKTNKRLDDISLTLRSVLSTISSAKAGGDIACGNIASPSVGETKGTKDDGHAGVKELLQQGGGSREQWWDEMMKSTDDEVHEVEVSSYIV